jgi:chemotaxis signal transduction protein
MMTRASELRDAFDRGFAAAELPPEAARSDFLCIQVDGQRAAIRPCDIASLHADLRIVALPTRTPALLGVAAIRAAVVPIYDLSAAFGGSAIGATRWIVLLRSGSAGFAFAGFDGHARIPDASIAVATQRGSIVGQFILGGQPYSIVDVGSVLAAIETRWRNRGTAKDQ